jgi:hypothetical protein
MQRVYSSLEKFISLRECPSSVLVACNRLVLFDICSTVMLRFPSGKMKSFRFSDNRLVEARMIMVEQQEHIKIVSQLPRA